MPALLDSHRTCDFSFSGHSILLLSHLLPEPFKLNMTCLKSFTLCHIDDYESLKVIGTLSVAVIFQRRTHSAFVGCFPQTVEGSETAWGTGPRTAC